MSGSSNAFANGSNQNCGNVITDRSTTRLHAPPGGQTSFSLGWGSEPAPAAVPSRRLKENTVNQAPAPAPVQKERHPQTNSSIFNQETEAPQQQQQQQQQRHPQTNSSIFNQEAETAAPRQQQQCHPQTTSTIFNQEPDVVAPRQQQQKQEDSIIFGGQRTNGSNAYANGANQNCGNVLTDRSTTRLHAPPGGASTFKLY
eukprot:CAMPEP_0182552884 /NCGR_PEP_ID=MMETSP1323-20130603/49205_1 /TAXON_ID=236787 /ORGANISM="Florenciella parvula, Strain RCC1693" /LENGTH=199 /DNA_ID=CAMNT_0024764597 /DNA_START=608 /DNA_END=1207 /DNA_ORIENTATION=-